MISHLLYLHSLTCLILKDIGERKKKNKKPKKRRTMRVKKMVKK